MTIQSFPDAAMVPVLHSERPSKQLPTELLSIVSEHSFRSIAPPLWLLALTVSGVNIGMALLAPAIPLLRDDLSATGDEAQLVLSAFLIMLGLGQLVAGSLSDTLGRRPVLLSGSLLFAIAGAAALVAPRRTSPGGKRPRASPRP